MVNLDYNKIGAAKEHLLTFFFIAMLNLCHIHRKLSALVTFVMKVQLKIHIEIFMQPLLEFITWHVDSHFIWNLDYNKIGAAKEHLLTFCGRIMLRPVYPLIFNIHPVLLDISEIL
jgi:hypothetical protein